jgi:hypothetical protein
MALVSFGEAAQLCGHRSRSTLYNLRNDGRLEGYLAPGPKGKPWLETHPPGREPLVSFVLSVVRFQYNPERMEQNARGQNLTSGPWHFSTATPPAPPPPLPWSGYVREADPGGPELSHEEFWANVAALFDASANDVFPPRMTGSQCHSFWLLLSEAMETIEGGGRWDESVWLAASLNDATDNDERGWVESLLASGRLSAELEAQAREWLLSCDEPPPPM